MNISIQVLPFGGPAQQESVELRRRVLRIPLGLEYTPLELQAEYGQVHLGALLDGRVVGVLLLVPLPENLLKMRQFAVDEAFQGKGIGKALVRFAELWALEEGFDIIVLHARETAVPFYLRLHYHIEGDTFTEVGIPHKKMVKIL